MAAVEMKIRMVMSKGDVQMALQFVFLPRGSGNRNKAQRMAEHLRKRKDLKPHLIRVVCGVSKVVAYLRPSFGLVKYFMTFGREVAVDEEGQLPLFLAADGKPGSSLR